MNSIQIKSTFIAGIMCCLANAGSVPDTGVPVPAGETVSKNTAPGYTGILFKTDGEKILIRNLVPGMPAARSGMLRPGDEIVSTAAKGHEPVGAHGLDLPAFYSQIKGVLGSQVDMVVARVENGTRREIKVSLTREPLKATVLSPGNPTPEWKTGEWIQGEPVKELERGKAYLIECWATWCAPCVAGIPHLNELHLKFKDRGLVVIGQNVAQKDVALVKAFVDSMGDKMTYRVVMDDIPESGVKNSISGIMADAWIQPEVAASYGMSYGIPTAFLVGKDGLIVWSGDPKNLDTATIEAALGGK